MQRGALLALPLLLAATGLSGCGLLDGSSSLDEALEAMPGTVTRVTFFDRAAASDRLDLGELDADSGEEEIEAYVEKARELPWSTALDAWLVQMLGAAPFTAQDLEWEAIGYDADGGSSRVWKLDDDVDLDEVSDFLDETEPEQTEFLPALGELTVVEDEHLIVGGALTDDVLKAVADDSDSLVDTGSFEELVDSTDDVEVADLSREDAVCSLSGSRVSREQLEASGVADLAAPEQSGFFVHGDDGEPRAVLVFDDDETADEEAEARTEFLADGTSPISGVPYSEFGSADVEADGDQVRIDLEYDDPTDLPAVISRRDFPSVCVPG